MTCLEELGDLDEDGRRFRETKNQITQGNQDRSCNAETTTQAPPKQEQQKGGATSDDRRTETGERTQTKKETGKGSETTSKPASTGAKAPAEREKDKKAPDTKAEEGKIKPSEAQIKAIEKLAERRGINGEQLVKIFTDKYQKPYEQINASEAKEFIRHLQQAA